MNILITGGAGFKGFNLCEYFLQQEHQVPCLDNLATSFIENMDAFINHLNFEFFEGNICDLETSRQAVEIHYFICNYIKNKLISL